MAKKKPIFSFREITRGKRHFGRMVDKITALYSTYPVGFHPDVEDDDIHWSKGERSGCCSSQDFARWVRAQKRARRLKRESR